jgi:ferredoxin--NADP+ reductase
VSRSGLNKNSITGNKEIAPGVFLLSFEKQYDFIPGQIIALTLDANDHEPRLYSICSGTGEHVISILYNIIPEGKITGRLSTLKKGDYVYTSNPYGRFTISQGKAFCIASGTGIAPFISLIRSVPGFGGYLIHGGRDESSFYFSDELAGILGKKYIKCSSTIDKKGYYSGRLTSFLINTEDLPEDYRYYLCGRAEMVVEARDILISRGIPYNMIESEIYF